MPRLSRWAQGGAWPDRSLLYDSVTDKDSREKLAESLGFCNLHSRELLSFPGERLGATIIEWAVLREAQRRLQRSAPAGAPGIRQRLRGQTAGESSLARPGRARSAGTRLSWRRARCESCWSTSWAIWMFPPGRRRPVLAASGPGDGRGQRPRVHGSLVKLHSDVWQGLIDQMGEFIRKRDYRFSGETITDEETAAMETAIKVLTGMYPPVS